MRSQVTIRHVEMEEWNRVDGLDCCCDHRLRNRSKFVLPCILRLMAIHFLIIIEHVMMVEWHHVHEFDQRFNHKLQNLLMFIHPCIWQQMAMN